MIEHEEQRKAVDTAYRVGPFVVQPLERTVSQQGQRLVLREKAFQLLDLLARHSGRVVDKATVVSSLWPGVRVHENNVAVTVRAVRQVLSEHDPDTAYIQTVPRRGYRWLVAPRPLPAAPVRAIARAAVNTVGERTSEGRAFVGRERELEALSTRWARARSGNGGLVFVRGEPGMGKSELLRHFSLMAERLAPNGLTLWGQCVPLFGDAEPFWPILSALSQELEGSDQTLRRALWTHARGWCGRLPMPFNPTEDELKSSTESGAGSDPQMETVHLLAAIQSASAQRPLLMVLEDLHWTDPSTIDLLRLLADRLEARSMLVIVSYRPKEVVDGLKPLMAMIGDLERQGRLEESSLLPWTRDEVDAYLASAFGGSGFCAELAALLHRRTEGLPLFVVRLVRALVETQALYCDPMGGHWLAAADLSSLVSSAAQDLNALIRIQLGALVPEEVQLLEVAAIEGEAFGTRSVAKIAGKLEAEVEATLLHLQESRGLVERLGEEGATAANLNVRFRFCHALFQSFLYEQMAGHRRVELHLAAAKVLLEGRGGGKCRLSEVAVHFQRGGAVPLAARYWIEAGYVAERRRASREALECFHRAQVLMVDLPPAEHRVRQLVIHHGSGWAKFVLRDLKGAAIHFAEMCRIGVALSRGELRLSPEHERFALEYFRGAWRNELMDRDCQILSGAEPGRLGFELEAEAVHCVCHVAAAGRDLTALLEHARRLHDLSIANGLRLYEAEAGTWLGEHGLQTGDVESSRKHLTRAYELAQGLGLERGQLRTSLLIGRVKRVQGELSSACEYFERSLQLAANAWSAMLTLLRLAEAQARLGRLELAASARERFRQLWRQGREKNTPPVDGWLWRELGQLQRAQRADEAALEALQSQNPLRGQFLISIAETLALRGHFSEAEAYLAQAVGLLPKARSSLPELRGACWAVRCTILHGRGDGPGLKRCVLRWQRAAEQWHARLDLRACQGWLARAEAASGQWQRARMHLLGALDSTAEFPEPLADWRLRALLATVADRLSEVELAERARSDARQQVAALSEDLETPHERRLLLQFAKVELTSVRSF